MPRHGAGRPVVMLKGSTGTTATRYCSHVLPQCRDFATDAPFASNAPHENLRQVSINIASDAPFEVSIAGRATYAYLGKRRMRHRSSLRQMRHLGGNGLAEVKPGVVLFLCAVDRCAGGPPARTVIPPAVLGRPVPLPVPSRPRAARLPTLVAVGCPL